MSEILQADETDLRRRLLFRPCLSKQELHDWIMVFLGLDLPDGIVDADSNSCPMDMVWECYSKMMAGDDEDFMRVLYYAARDSFKTLSAAVIEVLCVVHLSRNVAHMAAIQEQALKAQEYVKRCFRRPHLREFLIGDNERTTEIVRYYNPETKHSLTEAEFRELSSSDKAKHEEIARVLERYIEKDHYIKVVICTISGANSEHVPAFFIDEIDVVANPVAYEEAQNIPAGRGGKLPLTVLLSSRKSAYGLVQKEIDKAEKDSVTGTQSLNIRHWNIIDVTEACPPSRHRPDEPKELLYTSDDDLRHVDEAGYKELNFKDKEKFKPIEGFAGCKRCKLFPACKTRLATHQTSTSVLLKSIPEVIGKFNANSLDMAKAQLLCWKPTTTGLVYGRFDITKHVLSPAMAYEKIFGEPHPMPKTFTKAMLVETLKEREPQWYGGMDFGFSHNFAYVHGFQDGNRLFVTHCVSMPELEPDQMVEVCEPFKSMEPAIFADKENPQMIKVFKNNGFRMRDWKKGPVAGGISMVQAKLNPVMGSGQPELFFVHDIDEDPHMHTLITNFREYHWKTDSAGRPTNIPSEERDDEPDALRYLVVNVFTPKGKLSATSAVKTDDAVGAVYREDDWMKKKVAELTGQNYEPPDRRMRVETPPGYNYYSDSESKGTKPTQSQPQGPQGKKGRLVWDI